MRCDHTEPRDGIGPSLRDLHDDVGERPMPDPCAWFASSPEHRRSRGASDVRNFGDEPRLADPCFTFDDDDPTRSEARSSSLVRDQSDLGLSAHERHRVHTGHRSGGPHCHRRRCRRLAEQLAVRVLGRRRRPHTELVVETPTKLLELAERGYAVTRRAEGGHEQPRRGLVERVRCHHVAGEPDRLGCMACPERRRRGGEERSLGGRVEAIPPAQRPLTLRAREKRAPQRVRCPHGQRVGRAPVVSIESLLRIGDVPECRLDVDARLRREPECHDTVDGTE